MDFKVTRSLYLFSLDKRPLLVSLVAEPSLFRLPSLEPKISRNKSAQGKVLGEEEILTCSWKADCFLDLQPHKRRGANPRCLLPAVGLSYFANSEEPVAITALCCPTWLFDLILPLNLTSSGLKTQLSLWSISESQDVRSRQELGAGEIIKG